MIMMVTIMMYSWQGGDRSKQVSFVACCSVFVVVCYLLVLFVVFLVVDCSFLYIFVKCSNGFV